MMITRFTPFRTQTNDMTVLQNRLNSIFTEFARPEAENAELASGNFVPAVDVYENPQNLTLQFEIPGIRPEDLDIRVEGRTLTVRGERKWDSDLKEENVHRVERRYGTFVRSFTLPAAVDTESVQAETENGVLHLTLTKKAEAKPKQIQVKAAPAKPAEQSKQVEGAK